MTTYLHLTFYLLVPKQSFGTQLPRKLCLGLISKVSAPVRGGSQLRLTNNKQGIALFNRAMPYLFKEGNQ